MNLNQIKQEARDEVSRICSEWTNFNAGTIAESRWLATKLNPFLEETLDRLVDEIERAVVPQDPELAVKAEHIRKVLANFRGT